MSPDSSGGRQRKLKVRVAEAELLQDTLTCGSCQKVFVLSEIVKFIQHKVHSCNKENNFIILEDGGQPDFDSDDKEDPPGPLIAASKGPPSISAPICNRKGLHHQHHHLHRNRNRAEKSSSLPNSLKFGGEDGDLQNKGPLNLDLYDKKDYEDVKRKEIPVIKEEVKDPSLRCSPKSMVNAYTNTIITEPSTYTCSTCKQTFTSAWVLVQHAQHMHGMKIYLVTPYHGSRSSSTSSANALPPTGPPPSLINSSGSLGIPLPPVLPPCSSMNGPSHHPHAHHHSVLPQQALSLENHPALQLLRMPLGERQFPPTSLNAPGMFARPSSQDFRVDMLATSSSTSGNNSEGSQQFHRINHHPSHIPPHNAPSLPGLGIGSFDPHNPFIDRGPLGLDTRPRPPPMSLGFEPQMDFYSQRLRQLAGATSPTATSASPRKPSPPFTHPPMSSSSQPSTPTSTPQPVLNLHSSASGNGTPSHQHNSTNNNPAHRGSSASSTSSKGGGVTDAAEGSPKLLKSWSCEFCGKAFRFESNLIVHRRSHTGEKPYKCPICTHSCSQASKLKRHMKTHQNSNGKSANGSENNSLTSPRSTPDSTSETGKDLISNRPRSLDEDEDGSDGQTADNEEEEEDLDDEDEEEEDELDDEEDLDDSMMAEDLSTRGPNSSTPVPRGSPNSDQNKIPKTSDDVTTNNDNNSSNTISVSNGENGNNNEEKESSKPETRHSLLSEVMDKIGLSNIQQYNEAYKKALEESSLKNSSKEDTENSNRDRSSLTENGPDRPINREDTNSNTSKHGSNNNNKALVLHQHSMEFGHGFFGAFDYNHHHHHNAFEASKRLKMDIADHLRNSNDRDSLYAGLWLPSVHGSSHRDIYDMADISRHNKSSSSESALKSVTPTNMCNRSMSPRPGTSGGTPSVTPMPGLLVNSSKSSNSTKEQRRNDTCEFCGKVFKNCSNLTVHRRSHTGEKPYKCELCSYACAQSSKLTRHMKTHGRLGKDVYRCRFCDMPFSVPSTLEKHMRKCVVNQNATGVTYMDRDSDSKDLT
ncbi:unnamed protein product [Larinioides sclopetarius]|uniref:C2H2-type domain-containing protein n=1 Tax=Larinioides sclopetarius TaxID=280406 RepID=A0AAV1ZEZ3_9ARAC